MTTGCAALGRARPGAPRVDLRRHPAAAARDGRAQYGDYIPGRPMCRRSTGAAAGEFEPAVHPGDLVSPGDVLGQVAETESLAHRVLVPPGQARPGAGGPLRRATRSTTSSVVLGADAVDGATPRQIPCRLAQAWPVRRPRPVRRKLDPTIPLMTGQRIVDTLFPIAKGGVAVIPGGFGTGKTVLQQTLAKWADADVVVYVACGERGNEVTDVLASFPQLVDQRTGRPLIERTVLIANTSNMPVAAREASIYTGLTIAEYYRDMGYDVAMMADSTSRWAEALREVSGRLEEMPGEEGYPAYLASRLADFYERSGRAVCLGSDERDGLGDDDRRGEPPGRRLQRAGDAAQPARRRHVLGPRQRSGAPSPLPGDQLDPELLALPASAGRLVRERGGRSTGARRAIGRCRILQREIELQEIVQVVGPDALPEHERGAAGGRSAPPRGLPTAVRARSDRRVLPAREAARDAAGACSSSRMR